MVDTGFVRHCENPEYPFLDTSCPIAVGEYLSFRNLLDPGEAVVRVDPAGIATRNATVRVVTSRRSVVIKQFRRWTSGGRRDEQVSPEDRFRSECQFHRAARIADCLGRALPAILNHDPRTGRLVLEDFGASTSANGEPLAPDEVEKLAWFLISLHHHSLSVPACARYRPQSVVDWHRERLFGEPPAAADVAAGAKSWRDRLSNAGTAVAAGLADARHAVEAAEGASLVHGDFTFSNWLRTPCRPGVVDAELSFFGPPELDAGMFLGELMLSRPRRETMKRATAALRQGCMRYDARLTAAFGAAHFVARLGERSSRGAPSKSAIAGALRRWARAIEASSLEPLIPASNPRHAPATRSAA